MALSDILERGYFPKELPDPFVTAPFAAAVTASGAMLPAGFNRSFARGYPRFRAAKPVKYSYARGGGLLRRQFRLPNPVMHYLLCREIDGHWAALQSYIGGTALSATNPIAAPTGRAIQAAQPHSAGRELAIQTRFNSRYILRADISRFYESIYTHSIPWALHTKATAKANRRAALLGNRIDYLVRKAQDDQSVGIPIGPDTSLVIAEMLMQRCDAELLAAYPGIRGHRSIDDYELAFQSRSDAQVALDLLEGILADYELALNPRKTEIVDLPCAFEATWVNPLRSFEFRSTASGQRGDLFAFFDLVFHFHRQYPDDAVMQYAIRRLRNLKVHSSNWEVFQRLLLHCATLEPAALSYVLESIVDQVNAGASPALNPIGEVVDALITKHSVLAHSSEVAWALWACLALGITLSRSAGAAVSKCVDSVVALLALHCEDEGLVTAPLNHSAWATYMDGNGLYEEQWLLSYEANVKGWLPSLGRRDHVSADPNFGFLKAAGVSFYDVSRAVRPAPGAPVPVPTPPTPPPVPTVSPS